MTKRVIASAFVAFSTIACTTGCASGASTGAVARPPSISNGEKAGPWIVGGIGAAGLILGAAAGGIVLANDGTASTQCSSLSMTCTPRGHVAASRVSTFGPVTTAALVAGASGVAAGGIWLGIQRKRSAVSLRLAPTVSGSSWKLEMSW